MESRNITYGKPDPNEFLKFHKLLTAFCEDYKPWYHVLAKHDKEPAKIHYSWKSEKAQLTAEQAVKWMQLGYNIGIAGTPTDKLVIVDVDDETRVPKSELRPTLTIRSRKRIGRHHYYFTDDEPCTPGEQLPSRTAKRTIVCSSVGEVRSYWGYVVCPGSFVPLSSPQLEALSPSEREFAGYYTIETAMIPSNITYEQLPKVYKDQLEHNIRQAMIPKTEIPEGKRIIGKSAIFSLTVSDVMGNLPKNKHFPCPFHGSETGANASYDGDLLHCWRHEVAHNGLTCLGVLSGVAECGDAGFGHRASSSGRSSIDIGNGQQMFGIWKYAKERGIIAADDPIPSAALIWFADVADICKSSELVNGKLPVSAYIQAKELAKGVGII